MEMRKTFFPAGKAHNSKPQEVFFISLRCQRLKSGSRRRLSALNSIQRCMFNDNNSRKTNKFNGAELIIH
jgi:hypothetical protein